jgi:hypothetical protein
MLTVALIACTKQKLPQAAPAKELYTGDLFKKSRAYAEANTDEWWVLSARYGLVHPDEVIAPYDQTLQAMSGHYLHWWAQQVRDQLAVQYAGTVADGERVQFVFLAGRFYREWPTYYLGRTRWASCTDPLAGLGIGDRKAWMKARTPCAAV